MVNNQNCGIIIAPPFLFEIREAVVIGQSNQVKLELCQSGEIAPPPARFVAWPEINLPLQQNSNP
jgi:hypothetical protein